MEERKRSREVGEYKKRAESYSRRALRIAREAVDRSKKAGVAVSDAVAYMVAIYGNRKYEAGFDDARKLIEKEES